MVIANFIISVNNDRNLTKLNLNKNKFLNFFN